MLNQNELMEYVQGLYERARKAQSQIENYSQKQVNRLVAAISKELTQQDVMDVIINKVFDETEMGDIQSKYTKLLKTKITLWDIKDVKTVGIIEELPARGLIKIGRPVGVVAALTPSTQPEVTPAIMAMFAIKGRNAMVVSPHPKSKNSTKFVCELISDVLEKYGAPRDLIVCAENPTIPMSQEIMKYADLIIATGGQPMVRAAYSSGKPAYGAGIGNANVIVDETIDVAATAKTVAGSKAFDHSSGCSAENSIIVSDKIYNQFIQELKANGVYIANNKEKGLIQKAIWPEWPDNHMINRELITKPAAVVAEIAGITIPEGTKIIAVEETESGEKTPFAGEKLCPVFTIYKFKDFDEAVQIVKNNVAYMGEGHSCGIHSFNDERIMELAETIKVCRIAVRQGMASSNSGGWTSGNYSTTTLGGGTWGGAITSENITAKHFINTTTISLPISRPIPTDEELFSDLID